MTRLFVASIVVAAYLMNAFVTCSGVYLDWIKTYKCVSYDICIHEIGHKIDHVSQTSKYRIAVDTYRAMNWEYPQTRYEHSFEIAYYPGLGSLKFANYNIFTKDFWTGGWGSYFELYAEMLRWSEGKQENMPIYFREFYDWDLVAKEMQKIQPGLEDCIVTEKITLCKTAKLGIAVRAK